MYIPGHDTPDTLQGTGDADSIEGFGGNDAIFDGNGNDTVLGGDGDDLLNATGLNDNDIFDGGAGYDWVTYSNLTGPVTINLATQTATGLSTGADTLLSIENAQGSQSGDLITGTRRDNILDGRSGDDSLYGGNGDDLLLGMVGDDQLYGGSGRDVAYYENDGGGNGGVHGIHADLNTNIVIDTSGGTDHLTGIEDIDGSVFADVLLGRDGTTAAGQNALRGFQGNDTLDGRGGSDYLSGGGGMDTFVFSTRGGFDWVDDFVHGMDHIKLSAQAFGALGASFTKAEFHLDGVSDGHSGIFYDRGTGLLSFEFYSSGGAGSSGIIAQLQAHTLLTFSDIVFG